MPRPPALQRSFRVLSDRTEDRANDEEPQELPSSYWRRDIRTTFMRNAVSIRTRVFVGLKTLMFHTDPSHGLSAYPNSRKVIDELFDGVDDAVRDQIIYGNAAELHGF